MSFTCGSLSELFSVAKNHTTAINYGRDMTSRARGEGEELKYQESWDGVISELLELCQWCYNDSSRLLDSLSRVCAFVGKQGLFKEEWSDGQWEVWQWPPVSVSDAL